MADGWIKLHRCLLKKAIWKCSTSEQKVILVTLLMMANHEENEWEWKGEKFIAAPGQFVTSLKSIARACGNDISEMQIRTAIQKFEKYEFLTSQVTNRNRLITIMNWGIYQSPENKSNRLLNKPVTSQQQADNKPVTTNKNVKNVKNVKNKDIYAEKVTLTSDEYQKLLDKFGEVETRERIERLSLYKMSTGTKYESDYATILMWAKKDKEKAAPVKVVKPTFNEYSEFG